MAGDVLIANRHSFHPWRLYPGSEERFTLRAPRGPQGGEPRRRLSLEPACLFPAFGAGASPF